MHGRGTAYPIGSSGWGRTEYTSIYLDIYALKDLPSFTKLFAMESAGRSPSSSASCREAEIMRKSVFGGQNEIIIDLRPQS